MKRIVFVRHTTTAFNKEPIRLRGCIDVPLSPEGFTQIAGVIERFTQTYRDVRAIHSSTLARANILATSLAHEYDLKVEPSESLRSWDYGVLNGRPVSDVLDVLKTLSEGAGRELSPEGGESMNRFLQRYTNRIREIIAAAPEQGVVVVVTHLVNILAGTAYLEAGLPVDVTSWNYKYDASKELEPGTWREARREWVVESEKGH